MRLRQTDGYFIHSLQETWLAAAITQLTLALVFTWHLGHLWLGRGTFSLDQLEILIITFTNLMVGNIKDIFDSFIVNRGGRYSRPDGNILNEEARSCLTSPTMFPCSCLCLYVLYPHLLKALPAVSLFVCLLIIFSLFWDTQLHCQTNRRSNVKTLRIKSH